MGPIEATAPAFVAGNKVALTEDFCDDNFSFAKGKTGVVTGFTNSWQVRVSIFNPDTNRNETIEVPREFLEYS
ncbi:MAG: hypothetical protein OQJ98_01210 [Candidatus Pacebacteria bacterium]|nr:hypothetical protein [Candidatus Paceibacterota bacterium]